MKWVLSSGIYFVLFSMVLKTGPDKEPEKRVVTGFVVEPMMS
jgi:hypothetical protein